MPGEKDRDRTGLQAQRLDALRKALRTVIDLAKDAHPDVNDNAQEAAEAGEKALADDDQAAQEIIDQGDATA